MKRSVVMNKWGLDDQAFTIAVKSRPGQLLRPGVIYPGRTVFMVRKKIMHNFLGHEAERKKDQQNAARYSSYGWNPKQKDGLDSCKSNFFNLKIFLIFRPEKGGRLAMYDLAIEDFLSHQLYPDPLPHRRLLSHTSFSIFSNPV